MDKSHIFSNNPSCIVFTPNRPPEIFVQEEKEQENFEMKNSNQYNR